jgi:hypothetical protein
MALQNPSSLYTAGAVIAPTPNMALYANLLAKKQAKEEALNQYFTELGDKINTAGVRMQDLTGPTGGINDEIMQWRNDWIKNKDSIKRGGIAQQEHMAKLNQIQRKIAQSKHRATLALELGKAKFEGKYDPDDDDLNVIENIDKSIYDPTSYKQDGVTEYGWQDLSPSVPDFDLNKQNQFWTTASRGVKPGRIFDESKMRVDKTTGKAFVPYQEAYSPEQIKKISDDAADLVNGDRSARKYYNKILDNPTSDQWKKLNDAYQGIYGKNTIVETPEQAAQADLIIKASGVFDAGEQLVTDQDLAFQRSLAKMAYNSGLISSRSSGKGQGPTDLSKYDLLGDYGDKVVNIDIPLLGVKQNVVKVKDIGAQDMNIITANGTVQPYKVGDEKYFIVRDDGDWEGKGGRVVNRANVARANLDRTSIAEDKRMGEVDELKERWKKPASRTGSGGTKYPLPKNKPRTVKQNGHTYTWNEKTGAYE